MKSENQFSVLNKHSLRATYKLIRKNTDNREEKNSKIFKNVINNEHYKNAETVLIYVSTDDEVDTRELINYSLKDGKRVAVPFCTEIKGIMEFYIIDSPDNLLKGKYSISEPDVNKCKKLDVFSNCIAIVPGLCFSKKGDRLGYGGGYYDRFLKNFPFISLGLCYNSCIFNILKSDINDVRVDYVITENSIFGG